MASGYLFIISFASLVLSNLPSVVAVGENKLFGDLFENYRSAARPRRDPSEAIDVYIEYVMNTIKELDEKSQILQTVGYMEAKWTDDYLQWDPSEYSNITEIIVPPEQIWLPDFGIENCAEQFYEETFFTYFRVVVKHTGLMRWSFGGVFSTSCDLDTTFYPFDIQRCQIRLVNWAYGGKAVYLHNGSSSMILTKFQPHGIWNVHSTVAFAENVYYDTDPDTAFPRVTFELRLLRKPRYYIVNIMIPCLFLTALALLVYLLPPDSGEKVSLGVTVLLAFSVFQFVIADNTPKNSDSTPLLSMFVILTMGLSSISVITTIAVLHLHHKSSNNPVPSWIRLVFFQYISRLVCLKAHKPQADTLQENKALDAVNSNGAKNGDATADDVERKIGENHNKLDQIDKRDGNEQSNQPQDDNIVDCLINSTPAELQRIRLELQRVTAYIDLVTSRMNDRDEEQSVNDDWRALAMIVDRLMFYVTIICMVLSAIIVFIYSWAHRTPDYL